jgi:hypothetical protein
MIKSPVDARVDVANSATQFAEMLDLTGSVRSQRKDWLRTQPKQCEAHDDELRDIGQLHDNPVAGRDAVPDETSRHSVGEHVKFGVRQASMPMYQSGLFLEPVRGRPEQIAEMFTSPISPLPVALGERSWPRRASV